jgi:RNA polymerase sigma-70 factor (ECF subfamily)
MLNRFYYNYRSKKHKPETTVLEEFDSIYLYIKTEESGLHAEADDPAAYVLAKMTEEQIQEAMNALPEEYRVASVLYFMEECTYQEIADILECPVGTVRSRLHRGRKLLQKALWRLVEDHSILGEGGGT